MKTEGGRNNIPAPFSRLLFFPRHSKTGILFCEWVSISEDEILECANRLLLCLGSKEEEDGTFARHLC